MTHALNKLPTTKSSYSRHQYQQVPLEIPLGAESSSEDGDTMLYMAPSLNETNLQTFGVSVYDHSHDLDLPRIRRLQDKSRTDRTGREKNCANSKALPCIFVVVSCLLITFISAFAILVAGNWDYFSISSNLSGSTLSGSTPTLSYFTTSICDRSQISCRMTHESTLPPGTTHSSPSLPSPSETSSSITTSSEEEAEMSSCATIPKPLPTVHSLPYHSPSFFTSLSHSMNLGTSAIIFPMPSPMMVATPTNDDATTTGAPGMETMLPTNFERPTLESVENDTVKKSLPTTMENGKGSQPIETSSFIPPLQSKPLSWERIFMAAVSESTPVVFDLDGDGMGERLVVECFSILCTSRISALSGINGSTVWQQEVYFLIFAVRCILDANGDGNMDCVVAGRGGGFLTLDGSNGHLLWAVDESLVFPMYNFYFPLLLPDFNGDGVHDLINIHGGDVRYSPEEHNRSPAYLVAVSGKTGQKLMNPIFMPDGHESYNSPILFSINNVDQLVLFGSGGESDSGSLWGIELKSLWSRITSYLANTFIHPDYQINLNYTFHPCFLDPQADGFSRPVMDTTKFDLHRTQTTVSSGKSECPTWGKKNMAIWNDYNVCLYEFVRSVSKGVMVPPVAVDLTGDGLKDLVVSIFDGQTIALDGRDLDHILWEVYYPGTESYSVPAPLFYTSDDIPDLLIRTNLGSWSVGYNVSNILVLDGRNGSVLWTYESTTFTIASAISVISLTHGRDAFIFYVSGETGGDGGDKANGVRDTGGNGMKRTRRHNEMAEEFGEAGDIVQLEMNKLFLDEFPELWVSTPDDPLPDNITLDSLLNYCGKSKADMTISLYMVTREMIESEMQILPIATYGPHLFIYPSDNHGNHSIRHQHIVKKRHDGAPPKPEDENDFTNIDSRKSSRCEHIASPTQVIGTPLLGDLNLDGRLDIMYDIVWSSIAPFQMLVVATDLEVLFEGAYGKGILDFETFLPPGEQPWTKYMGRDGDGVFKQPPQS